MKLRTGSGPLVREALIVDRNLAEGKSLAARSLRALLEASRAKPDA